MTEIGISLILWISIISGSSRPTFIKFSSYGSQLVVDQRSDFPFLIAQGMLP